MDKIKKVKAIGNIIGFNIDGSGNETYNVQFPDMTIAELESYQFEEADAYCANENPLYLRNVLARLRGLPEHDRKVWMDEIMHEFASDYGLVKYTLGYEQGKFDGAVEAEKSNKVVIPQFVADWYENYKDEFEYYLKGFISKVDYEINHNTKNQFYQWLGNPYNDPILTLVNMHQFGYEVEKEKRYEVSIKASGQYLARTKLKEIAFMYNGACSRFTRKELEEDGFGWVFDCDGVKVQEVTDDLER